MNEKGLDLIKKWEGLRLTAYKCPAGKYTIGYGHTRNVREGITITEQQACELLLDDIGEIESYMEKALKVELNDNQWSALVCLIFNIGIGAFTNSTLLKMLNINKIVPASQEFLRWCKVDGQPSKGLMARRIEEKDLFNLPI